MKPIVKICGSAPHSVRTVLVLAPEAQAFRGRGRPSSSGPPSARRTRQRPRPRPLRPAAGGGSAAAGGRGSAAGGRGPAAARRREGEDRSGPAGGGGGQETGRGPARARAGSPLPLGTVVATLPGGCTRHPGGGVNYYYCGGNFYQAVYEGSTPEVRDDETEVSASRRPGEPAAPGPSSRHRSDQPGRRRR